jgi:hypothetical protein
MKRTTDAPRRLGLLAFAGLVGLLALGACKASDQPVPIKTLLDDPSRYDGQVVRVAGDVGAAVGVLGVGAYQINDGTGTLYVVSKSGGAPREGARVGVEGTFKAVFTLGTWSGAGLEESRRYTP